MVPWLGFNLVLPLQGGGHTQQEPNSAKAPVVEAEGEENPEQGNWPESLPAGNWYSGKWTQQKAHGAQSQIPEDLRLSYEVLAPMAGGIFA